MTHDSSLEDDRNPVDVLADEFAARLRTGESPSMQEYVDRYPEYAAEIQELFPGVALLEQLSEKQDSEASFQQQTRQDSLPAGHRFGDIEIVREVGRGGMGIVYEAYQHSLNRSVAVKAMSGSALNSAKQAMRFQREAQAAAQLHHTNIVPVFGVGEQGGMNYYVMQLIHGLGLDTILSELARKVSDRGNANLAGDTAAEGPDESSFSAREFADVLVSGQLSESSVRTGAGSTSITPPPPNPADAPTVVYPQRLAEGQTVLENRAEDRTDDRTGEVGSGETPQTFVRSSLELRDEQPPSVSVRSSLVLREELPEEETFETTAEQTPKEVAEDPRLASLGQRYWRNIARVGLQVASGLHYAHAQGTLHRDIKPANILLDTDGIAWIADFGLAKLLQQEDVTKTGDVVGTLRYMAPEQFRGKTDARSDLYSFGLTLYELLTLRPAYDDTDRQQLIARKLTPHDPPHPRKYHRGISRDLETIVLKCLAWEPDRRYQSAGALVADLQAFLEDRPIQARRINPVERFGRWCKRNPVVASLSMAVLLLLMTTATLLSIGYVRAEKRAEGAQTRLDEMESLRDDARKGEAAAERAARELEQIVDWQWQAFDTMFAKVVPERYAGPVEASVEDDETGLETESTATVLSPQTAALLETMVTSLDEFAKIRGTDARHLEETAKANRKVGDLHLRLGQHEDAIVAFERAIDRYRQLEGMSGSTTETSLMLARLSNGLSVAYGNLDRREESQAALRQSLEILSQPTLDQNDPTVRFETASTHYLMARRPAWGGRGGGSRGGGPLPGPGRGGRGGSGRPGERRPDGSERPPRGDQFSQVGGAEEGPPGSNHNRGERRRPGSEYAANSAHFQSAISLLDPLIEEYPAVPEYQFLLALCHIELSHPWTSPEETSAGDRLARAIEILQRLVADHPGEPDYLYQLSEAYEQRYNQSQRSGGSLFLRMMAHREQESPVLVRPWPFGPPFVQILAREENGTGRENITQAEEDLREAVRLSSILLGQQPNVPRYAESHIWLLYKLVDVLAVRGQTKEALDVLEDASELREANKQRFPEMGSGPGRGSYSDLLRAYLLIESKSPAEARNLLQSLIQKSESASREESSRRGSGSFSPQFLRPVFLLLARAHQALGETEAAADALKKFQQFPSESPWRSPRNSGGRNRND